MTDDLDHSWQQLAGDYLKRVERALEGTGHRRRGQVLEDVKAHLAARYEELSPAERTPQRMKAIIEEMGKPSEYVEMLGRDEGISPRSFWRQRHVRYSLALLVAGGAIAALIVWDVQALAGFVLALTGLALVALVVKYVRTRDPGFLWLGAAVVLWPVGWMVLEGTVTLPAIGRHFRHEPIGYFPFTLVDTGRISIGYLIAVLNYLRLIGQYVLILIAIVKLASHAPPSSGLRASRRRQAAGNGGYGSGA